MNLLSCLKGVKRLKFYVLSARAPDGRHIFVSEADATRFTKVPNSVQFGGLTADGNLIATVSGNHIRIDVGGIQADTGCVQTNTSMWSLIIWPEYKEELDKCRETSTK